jgi:hypothetical protein
LNLNPLAVATPVACQTNINWLHRGESDARERQKMFIYGNIRGGDNVSSLAGEIPSIWLLATHKLPSQFELIYFAIVLDSHFDALANSTSKSHYKFEISR